MELPCSDATPPAQGPQDQPWALGLWLTCHDHERLVRAHWLRQLKRSVVRFIFPSHMVMGICHARIVVVHHPQCALPMRNSVEGGGGGEAEQAEKTKKTEKTLKSQSEAALMALRNVTEIIDTRHICAEEQRPRQAGSCIRHRSSSLSWAAPDAAPSSSL